MSVIIPLNQYKELKQKKRSRPFSAVSPRIIWYNTVEWDRDTPFGGPVVPEEQTMTAGRMDPLAIAEGLERINL